MIKVKNLYKILMNETFEEFKLFSYKLDHPATDDGTACPECFLASRKIYAFDADFQLVRKYSAGKEWAEPRHKDRFFLEQDKVDDFIKCYHSDKGGYKEMCSDFQAGNSLRSKIKNKKLDETAVFGSTCRHGYPKLFFSLKHGERLGYAVFLLKTLAENNCDEDQMYILYDIACILYSHLKKQGDNILTKIILSIPIFHAYGHKVSCQVLYSPRRTHGIGMTDGESVERLWSYLGKFSNITKEQTPENRIDLLVDGLIYYGSLLRDKIGIVQPRKLQKAETLEKTSIEALDELLAPFQDVTAETVLQWIKEQKDDCIRTIPNKKGSVNTRQNLLAMIKDQVAERCFLLELIKKYARGQAIAYRLSRQVKSVNQKIKKLIEKHNLLDGQNLTFKEVTDKDNIEVNPAAASEALKREAINLRLLVDRSREEQVLLKEEMVSAYRFYEHHRDLLLNMMNTEENNDVTMIVKEGAYLEMKLTFLSNQFSKYVQLPVYVPYFTFCQDLADVYVNDEEDNNDFDDDDDDGDDDDDDDDVDDVDDVGDDHD